MDADTAWACAITPFFAGFAEREWALRREADLAKIDLDQSCRSPDRGFCTSSSRETLSMTPETMLIVSAITVAFAAFALTLWRAEHLTRDLKH
jgi:hypothetical protein